MAETLLSAATLILQGPSPSSETRTDPAPTALRVVDEERGNPLARSALLGGKSELLVVVPEDDDEERWSILPSLRGSVEPGGGGGARAFPAASTEALVANDGADDGEWTSAGRGGESEVVVTVEWKGGEPLLNDNGDGAAGEELAIRTASLAAIDDEPVLAGGPDITRGGSREVCG